MARHLPLAPRFELATLRRVCRGRLCGAKSFLRVLLQPRSQQRRGDDDFPVVSGLFLLQCANPGHGGLRPHVSANDLRSHRQHGGDHDRRVLARGHDRIDLRPLFPSGCARRF